MKNRNTYWIQALTVVIAAVYFFSNYNKSADRPVWSFLKGNSYIYSYKSTGLVEGKAISSNLKVEMKADLIRYIEKKDQKGWTEEVYLKTFHS